MQISIGVGIEPGQHMAVVNRTAEPSDAISRVSVVAQDGWRATHRDAPTFDAETEMPLIVHRQGFDETGSATVRTDSVAVAARIRHPFPDQSQLTPDAVALSDFVYAEDTIAGASNTSLRPYPKPVAMWLNHDRERASSETHTVRLAVAHAHARQGCPVAAVKFIARDGVTEAMTIVSTMTSVTFDASGLSVPHFAGQIDLSDLEQGALLTVDAVIYPWVGKPFTISLDADPYPSPNLTTLKILNDRLGEYGTAIAYVDGVAGSDASGVVSDVATTAQAAPFATIAAAVTAVKGFNDTAYGRANDVGGGVIKLAEGVHTHTPFKAQGTAADIPLVIEASDPAKRATTILTDGGTSTFNGIPTLLKLRNLTLLKTGASVVFLDSGATSADSLLVTENCIWDGNGTSYYGAWVYRVGRFVQINCAIGPGGDPKQGSFFSTEAIMGIAIGCHGCAGTIFYQAAGCAALSDFNLRSALGARPAMTGVFLGWNVFSNGATVNPIIYVGSEIGPRGLAFVGNLVESWGSATNAAIRLNADSDTNPAENIVLMHNTVVGERANLLYLDGNMNVDKSAYVRFNVFHRYNVKGDVFASHGENTGNWAARFKVGWHSNATLDGSNNSGEFGPASWLGEIPSTGETTGTSPMWQQDHSHSGESSGGGIYIPVAGHTLPVVPPGAAAYPTDLFGHQIIAGQSPIGAVQPTF